MKKKEEKREGARIEGNTPHFPTQWEATYTEAQIRQRG
jgi:hypothetical protein